MNKKVWKINKLMSFWIKIKESLKLTQSNFTQVWPGLSSHDLTFQFIEFDQVNFQLGLKTNHSQVIFRVTGH